MDRPLHACPRCGSAVIDRGVHGKRCQEVENLLAERREGRTVDVRHEAEVQMERRTSR